MPERLAKVNQLVRKELSKILLKEVDFPPGVLVTLTRIDTAPNLTQARAYVSSLPENKTKEVISTLQKQVYSIQQKLNRRLNMRPTPKIIFVEETETEKAGKVEKLLAGLKKDRK